MNTDLRLSVHFFNDIKIKRLTAIHGDKGVTGLLKLWAFAATHRPSGLLTDISDDEVQFITEVPAPEYLDNLIKLNLLERAAESLFIVNWEKHQTWVIGAEARSERARVAAVARWDAKQSNEARKNAK